jgi:hypothetical protein
MKRTDMQKKVQRLLSSIPPKKTIEKKQTKVVEESKTPTTLKSQNVQEFQLKSKLIQCVKLLPYCTDNAYYKLVIQILNIAVKLGYDTGFKFRGTPMILCATINLPEIGWVYYPINPPKSKDPDYEVSDETSKKRTDLFIEAFKEQHENSGEDDGYVLIGGHHEDQNSYDMQMWLVPNNDPKHQEMIKYLREVGLDKKYWDFLLTEDGLKEFDVEFPINVKITEFIGLNFDC